MNCILPNAIKPIADKYGVSVDSITTATYLFMTKMGIDEYSEKDPNYINFLDDYFLNTKKAEFPNETSFNLANEIYKKTNNGIIENPNAKLLEDIKKAFGENNVIVYTDNTNTPCIKVAQPTLNGYTKEMLDIKDKALKDGTFMKAPNGEPTNLTEKQWLQVRTKAFKDWFGDWEKLAKEEQSEIDFTKALQEFENSSATIDKKSIALSNLKPNEKSDEQVLLDAGYKKVGNMFVSPDFDKTILSIIPTQLLKIMEKSGVRVLSFGKGDYSAMSGGIKVNGHSIGEIRFTTDNDASRIAHNVLHEIGHYLYNHYLNENERNSASIYNSPISIYIKNLINGAKTSGASIGEENFVEGFATYFHNKIFGNRSITTNIEGHLVDLYRNLYKEFGNNNNVSKVVDENGEPWVVYHGGRKNIDIFKEKSDRFEDTYGIYTTDDKIKAGVYAMMERGDIYSVFLNIKNPKIVNDKSSFHITEEALRQLQNEGYDGVVNPTEGELVILLSNQIKSATDNDGRFSIEDDNIYKNIITDSEYNSLLEELKLSTEKTDLFLYNFMTKVLNVNPRYKVDENSKTFVSDYVFNRSAGIDPEDINKILKRIFGVKLKQQIDVNTKEEFIKSIDNLLDSWEDDLNEEINNPIDIDDVFLEKRKIGENINLLQRFLNRNVNRNEFTKEELSKIDKIFDNKENVTKQQIGFKIQRLKNDFKNSDVKIQHAIFKRNALLVAAKNRLVALKTIENLKNIVKERLVKEYESRTVKEATYSEKVLPKLKLINALNEAQKSSDSDSLSTALFPESEKRESSFDEVKNKILSINPEYKDLLELFHNANPNLKVYVGGNTKSAEMLNQTAGEFSPKENTIWLSNVTDVHTAIHELAHSATSYGLVMRTDKIKAFDESITKFMNYIRNYVEKNQIWTGYVDSTKGWFNFPASIYGFTKPAEFIAELFSNPKFQELLDLIPPMENKEFKSLLQEIWDEIIKFLNTFFGKNKKDKTALDQARKLGYAAMKLQTNHINSVYDQLKNMKDEKQKSIIKNQIQGENISSKGSELAKKLTNPGNNLKVQFRGKEFRNAEHAYQTWKSGEFDEDAYNSTAFKPVGKKPVNKKISYDLMVEILTAKLQQHPDLVKEVEERGGIDFIKKSTHNVFGDVFWEKQNGFIKALTQAAKNVKMKSAIDLKVEAVIKFCNDRFKFNPKDHTYSVKGYEDIYVTDKTASQFSYANKQLTLSKESITPHWGIPSTNLGSTVDQITRDFFNNNLKETYPNFEKDKLNDLISDLNVLKTWAKDRGITIISADFPMVGRLNGQLIGGAMDLMGYDENGNIFVFDMKNMRTLKNKNYLNTRYKAQQNIYRGLFDAVCQMAGVTGLNVAELKILQFNTEYKSKKVPMYPEGDYDVDESTKQLSLNGTPIQKLQDYYSPRLVLQNKNVPEDFAINLIDDISKQVTSLSEDELAVLFDTNDKDAIDTEIKNQFAETGQIIPELSKENIEDNDLYDGSIKDVDILEIANSIIDEMSSIYDRLSKGDDDALQLYQDITGISIPNKVSDEYKTFERIVKSDREQLIKSIAMEDLCNYIKNQIWKDDVDFVNEGGLDEVDENGNSVYTDEEKYRFNTIKKCYDNFDTLIENGYARMILLEKMSLQKGVAREDLKEDGEAEETTNIDLENTANKDLEHWMAEQMSVKASLSTDWRRILSKLFLYDENGNIEYHWWGLPKKLNADTVINNLLIWFKGCTNVDEMISVLERKSDKFYPEYRVILDILNNDEQLKSQFFQNFRKDFNVYSIVIADRNKKTGEVKYLTKVINNSSASDYLMNKLGYDFAVGFDLLNKIFPSDSKGFHNPDANEILKIRQDIERIGKLFNSEESYSDIDNQMEFSNLLKKFGLNFSRQTIGMMFDDIVRNAQGSRNDAQNILTYLNEILNKISSAENVNYSLFKENSNQNEISIRNEYKNIIELFNDYVETVIESSCYENGKMHYSFNPPSYTGKLFANLKSSLDNPAKFDDFIENEYGKYKWFASNSDENGGNRRWLQPALAIMHQKDGIGNLTPLAQKAREVIGHKTQLAYNKTPYVELGSLGYAMSILVEYFSENSKSKYKVANYRVPILSNKPSSEFISFIRFDGGNYKSEMTDYFRDVFTQECMRMRTVLERAANPNAKAIKFYDISKPSEKLIEKIKENKLTWEDINSLSGTGVEFKFLSFLNNLDSNIDGATELKEQILGYLNHSDFDNTILKPNFKKVFEAKMEDEYKEQLKYFESIGLFDKEDVGFGDNKITKYKNLDFLKLKSNTLEDQKNEAKDLLENFFWNDFLASINIIELTATDLAYYKNVEDFQKRFAQIHAPGLRLNTSAKHTIDGKFQEVSDGKSRTMYIPDMEYNTGIENEVAIAFDKLIETETNSSRKEALRSMKGVVTNALKGVNVADAQAYTSPTGMMKKLVMAGKWTNDMSEAYEKICNNDFDLSNLQILIQPLKPFVYSQIEKNSYAQTMNNLKVGLQNKNSEYMILLADAIMRGAKQNNKLVALFDFMEASAYDGRIVYRNKKLYKDNVALSKENAIEILSNKGLAIEDLKDGDIIERGTYNKHGIDTIQFESAVKVGLEGKVDINDNVETGEKTNYDEVIKRLKDAATSKIPDNLYDDRNVYEFDYEDYAVQQEVPAHLMDHSQLMGSQMRILGISDMPKDTKVNFVNRAGETLDTAEKVIQYYQSLIAKNINESFDVLMEELKLDKNLPKKDRNKVLSDLLIKEIKKDARYGADLKRACELNENGDFVIPLSDPIQSTRIQQLLHSIIKSRINKQKVAGGPVVQASSWGIDKKFRIRWKGETTKYGKQVDYTLKSKDDFKTEEEYITYLKDRLKSLDYFECAMPVPSAELEQDLKNLAKEIDGVSYNGRLATPQEAIDKGLISEEQLKSIGYRIPTEDKYSIYPMKVVEWVPREAGEVILLPEEITKLTGSDFDIDKTYVYLKAFNRKIDFNGLKDLLSRKVNSEEEINKIIQRWINNEPTILDGLIRTSSKNYISYKEEKGDNKDGRNNEIFDIQWTMLTHPNTMDKMFNPGSFDPQKKTARIIQILKATDQYSYNDLVKKSLDQLEEILKQFTSKNKNICFIGTQIQFHQQNMTAGKLIGIFANNNVSHAFVSMHNVNLNIDPDQPIVFDGVSFESAMRLDNIYALDGKTYISKNIAGFLAASVDAVKDPVLNYLNLNTFTSGVAMVLARLGFDIDSIGLFLSQPSIVRATQIYSNLNNDGYISAADATAQVLDELTEVGETDWRDTLKQTSTNLDKNSMSENLTKYDKNYQKEVLKTFYKLVNLSNNVNDLTFLTKFNSVSNAAGPSIANTILIKNRVDKFFDKMKSKNPPFSASASDVINKSPLLSSFYKTTVSEFGAAQKIFEIWFPHYTNKFKEIISRFENTTQSPLNEKTINNLILEFLLYKLTYGDNAFFNTSEENRKYFIYKFPKEFMNFKQNHPELAENVFLNAINIKTGTKKCNISTLESQVGGFSADMQELTKTQWSDLITSNDKEVRDMAKKLFIYCLYRNGFGFSPKTFIHLASVKTKLAMGYTNMVNDIEFNNDFVDSDDFIEQFKRNHSDELRIVPDVTKRVENLHIENKNGELRFDGNRKSDLNALLSINKDSAVSVIKFNKKLYSLIMQSDSYENGGFVIYKEVTPLGNLNNFLEYDMNNIDISTVISDKYVDDDSADNEPDNNDFSSLNDKTGESSQASQIEDDPAIKQAGIEQLNKMQDELSKLGMEIKEQPTNNPLNLDQKTQKQISQIAKESNICIKK